MGRQHQRLDRNEVQRVYQNGTRPKEMEIHNSRPAPEQMAPDDDDTELRGKINQ